MGAAEFLGEDSSAWIGAVTLVVPFFGYYFALFLRKLARPDLKFLPTLVVAVPASLILISSFNAILLNLATPTFGSLLFVTGFVMEQAILVDVAIAPLLAARISPNS